MLENLIIANINFYVDIVEKFYGNDPMKLYQEKSTIETLCFLLKKDEIEALENRLGFEFFVPCTQETLFSLLEFKMDEIINTSNITNSKKDYLLYLFQLIYKFYNKEFPLKKIRVRNGEEILNSIKF